MDKAEVGKLMVGLEDGLKTVKEKLTRGTNNLDFVSIVGMGGIGKTTMARKVYQELEYHFHIRAFCCVSQMYDMRKLLLEILPQITQLPDRMEERSNVDLCEILYRSLKGRRYLVVMDDVWDVGVWKDLGGYFPNDHKQSRIVFTSRENDVVLQVKGDISPYHLRLLSDDESWELLAKKALHQESCPQELLDVGKKIAKSCKGLPIAIVVVAGILARTEQERGKWEQLAESVSMDTQIECSHIFELSFKHLPEHLKPCFLYVAAFHEDFHIPVRKLLQLWIAEGFIPRIGHNYLEDVAEDYLMDLIGRNLVMLSEKRSIGGSKMCHLHDLMHKFCLEKAKEEKFVQLIQGYNWVAAFGSLDVSNPRFSSYYRGPLQNLSTYSFNPFLSTLLFFKGISWSYLKDYSFISGLKHLTVLDLAGYRITKFFFDMELPAQLRYLAVCGSIYDIPPSISLLSKLETLVVITTQLSRPVDLPSSIWEMVTLRHLHIDGNSSFKLPKPTRKLENLQTLCLLYTFPKETNEILKALPRLRRLKCSVLMFDSVSFEFPTQLESLHVDCYRCNLLCPFFHNHHLKKLTVSNIVLYGEITSEIARLPNLEVLKILSGDFMEDGWYMEDEKFLKLKFLKLSASNIERWNASSDHFPCLEKLVLHRCMELEGIPSSLGEIPTLQLIDVQWCSHGVASSVRKIQEEQTEMGNEELKVQIFPKD